MENTMENAEIGYNAEKITRTNSSTHFEYGTATWGIEGLYITWEGECWHSYEGCPGRQPYDSEYGHTEFYAYSEVGVVSLPDEYELIERP